MDILTLALAKKNSGSGGSGGVSEPQLLEEIVLSSADGDVGDYAVALSEEVKAQVASLFEKCKNLNRPLFVVCEMAGLKNSTYCFYSVGSATDFISWSYVTNVTDSEATLAHLTLIPGMLHATTTTGVTAVLNYGLPVTMRFYA